MSDAAPPVQAVGAARGDRAAPLTPARIDAVLAEFRCWLEALATETEPTTTAERVDLFTLIGQFTALRHEVNMQTKATRAATEQATEAIKQLSQPTEQEDGAEPLVKALIDIADALALSMRQVDKAQTAAVEALRPKDSVLNTPPQGFFAKLFGRAALPTQNNDVFEKLRPLLAGVSDGYALSLRRVERLLPEYGLETFACVGEPFDPEFMEVLEVVDDPGQASGTIVEEVRQGYLRDGKVFRFALVKVAR